MATVNLEAEAIKKHIAENKVQMTGYQAERHQILRDIRTKISRIRTEAAYKLEPRPYILGNVEQANRYKIEAYTYETVDALLLGATTALDAYIATTMFLK